MSPEDTHEARVQRLNQVLTARSPHMKPEKRGISSAVNIAADLFGDTEVIDTAFLCRTPPFRFRGSGIVVLTERALIAVDAHPSKEDRSTRIEWPDVQSIAESSGPGGVTLVVVLTRTGRLELGAGSEKYGRADEIIADLDLPRPRHKRPPAPFSRTGGKTRPFTGRRRLRLACGRTSEDYPR